MEIIDKLVHILKKPPRTVVFVLIVGLGLLLSAFLVNSFLELMEDLNEKELTPFDDKTTELIQSFRSEGLTDFFRFITKFGDQTFYILGFIVFTIIIYLIYKSIIKAVHSAIVLGTAAGINILLKDFIERSRPMGQRLIEVSSKSFPSGHAVSSAAFYGFMIYIIWRSKVNLWIKIITSTLLGLLIFLIGISRIYLGVHFASDVIAGWIAGGFFLIIFILAFYTIRHFKNNNS